MIILVGESVMLFKKFFILALVILSFTHCGLEVFEEFDSEVVLSLDQDISCSDKDYREELENYFVNDDLSNEEISTFFNCIIYGFKYSGESLKGEYFDNKKIKTLLRSFSSPNDDDFMTKAINIITDDRYFDLFLKLKSNIGYLLNVSHSGKKVDIQEQCFAKGDPATIGKKSPFDHSGLGRHEFDPFVRFLEDTKDLFIKVNNASQEVHARLSSLEESGKRDKEVLIKILKDKGFMKGLGLGFINSLNSKDLHKLSESLLQTMDYNTQSKAIFTKTQLKYMFFNLYFLNIFLDLYDKDESLSLEGQEVQNAFCLFDPLIEVLTSLFKFTEDSYAKHFQRFYPTHDIYYYVLKYQELPNFNLRYFKFHWFTFDRNQYNPVVGVHDLSAIYNNLLQPLIIPPEVE